MKLIYNDSECNKIVNLVEDSRYSFFLKPGILDKNFAEKNYNEFKFYWASVADNISLLKDNDLKHEKEVDKSMLEIDKAFDYVMRTNNKVLII